jgi:hypothetical protein
VFLAKPSVVFFTDYEIGPVYEVEILIPPHFLPYLKKFYYGTFELCTTLGKKLNAHKCSRAYHLASAAVYILQIRFHVLHYFMYFMYYNFFMCVHVHMHG